MGFASNLSFGCRVERKQQHRRKWNRASTDFSLSSLEPISGYVIDMAGQFDGEAQRWWSAGAGGRKTASKAQLAVRGISLAALALAGSFLLFSPTAVRGGKETSDPQFVEFGNFKRARQQVYPRQDAGPTTGGNGSTITSP